MAGYELDKINILNLEMKSKVSRMPTYNLLLQECHEPGGFLNKP